MKKSLKQMGWSLTAEFACGSAHDPCFACGWKESKEALKSCTSSCKVTASESEI